LRREAFASDDFGSMKLQSTATDLSNVHRFRASIAAKKSATSSLTFWLNGAFWQAFGTSFFSCYLFLRPLTEFRGLIMRKPQIEG